MRTSLLTSLLVIASIPALPAQTGLQGFGYCIDTAQYASRGTLGPGAGELLQGFPTNLARGVGGSACTCDIAGLRAVLQADNATAPIPFNWVVRTGSDSTGPGTTPASVLATVPMVFPTTGGGPATYLLTVSFATPIATPCSGFIAAGVQLPAAGTTLGLMLHIVVPRSGGAAHPNADDIAWEIPAGASSARHPIPEQVIRLELLTRAPTLQVGNIVAIWPPPLFGIGGAFPDTTAAGRSSQGLAVRVFAPAGPQASVLVAGALGFAATPFPVPGVLADCLYLDRNALIPAVVASGVGDGTPMGIVSAGNNVLPSVRGVTIVWQSVVLDRGVASATNAVVTVLL